MYLANGTVLNNRYEIEGVLGHGGFGITYAAYDQSFGARVAIKEYLPRHLATRGEGKAWVSVYSGEARRHFDYGLKKFMEEAQLLAQFAHHPNVVSARDYFEANGTAYMVMEYAEGVTLKEYLEKKGGRISFEEARGIMMPVMDALREVHQVGLLHRDISPDNIYITTAAQVRVIDFGAARYFAGEHSKSLSVILKSGYAPEEQYRSSGNQGAWTDVYAVGATIYKCLTGQTPPDALDRMAKDTLEPPSRLGVNIPPPAERALLQALAVNAGQRFQSMGEFQQALLGGQTMPEQFQPLHAPLKPAPEPSYTPVAAPGAAPVSAPPQPPVYPQPAPPPSHYPQAPRRSANPVAIAAGIGAGVIGLVLVVGLIWYLVGPPEIKLLKQGTEYVQAQDYPKALLVLEKARVLAPNDARIHLQLAKTYHGLKQYAEEMKACQEVLRLDSGNVEARYLLDKEVQRREAIQREERKKQELAQKEAMEKAREDKKRREEAERQRQAEAKREEIRLKNEEKKREAEKREAEEHERQQKLQAEQQRRMAEQQQRDKERQWQAQLEQQLRAQQMAQPDRVIINVLRLPPRFQSGNTILLECLYTVVSGIDRQIPVDILIRARGVSPFMEGRVIKQWRDIKSSGQHHFQYPLDIAQNIPVGDYMIELEIRTASAKAKNEVPFSIRPNY